MLCRCRREAIVLCGIFSSQARSLVRQRRLPHICAARASSSISAPKILPAGNPLEEERTPGYRQDHYYPAHPGQVLDDRYKIISKLGYGTASTVWLAEDQAKTPVEYVTVKIGIADPNTKDMMLHELQINDKLAKDTSQLGYAFIRHAIDNFVAIGASGAAHLCLVFDVMREPLSQYQHRLVGDKLPFQLVQIYTKLLLEALDYLHFECSIIHTDLKADNIMMTFEDLSVLHEYVDAQSDHPMPRKISNDRNIYLSHNDFGNLKSSNLFPKISDFGLAHHNDGAEQLRHPIQPPIYHAPEVLLGIPWSYSADIWNLGVLLFELLEDRELFVHLKPQDNVYSPKARIAEMIALLGRPPQKLLDLEQHWRHVPWERSFPKPDGVYRNTACEFYGGPFFTSDGSFVDDAMIPASICLEDFITSMDGEEKVLFLQFVRRMLKWLPEDRASARELLEDPWMQSALA